MSFWVWQMLRSCRHYASSYVPAIATMPAACCLLPAAGMTPGLIEMVVETDHSFSMKVYLICHCRTSPVATMSSKTPTIPGVMDVSTTVALLASIPADFGVQEILLTTIISSILHIKPVVEEPIITGIETEAIDLGTRVPDADMSVPWIIASKHPVNLLCCR